MSHGRRAALRRIALTATTVGLAGCGSSSGSDAEGSPDDRTGGSTPQTTVEPQARTSTQTPTASPTQTSAPTRTSTPAQTSTPTQTQTPTPGRGQYTVGMYTDLYYDPVGLHVEPGETVSFELASGAHSATAYHPDNQNALRRRVPDTAAAWDTEVFGETGAYRNVTFEAEGTHDYFCIPHKMIGMVGRVVVGEPGGPAEESQNPDLRLPDSERIVEEGRVTWDDWESEV